MILTILLYFGMIAFLALYVGCIYGVYMFAKILIQSRPSGVGFVSVVSGYALGLTMLAICSSFVYVATFQVLPRFFA